MLKKLILIIIAIFLIPVAAEQIQTMSSASKNSEQEQAEEETDSFSSDDASDTETYDTGDTTEESYESTQTLSDDSKPKNSGETENKETNEEFDWKSGYEKVLLNVKDYFQIENDTECSLKDLDLDGIPELHIVTNGGADGLLGNAVIFYYDGSHNLQSAKYEYAWQSAPSPQLYTNSKGEYAWLVQNLCYDNKSNFISNSSIEYDGVDARKMTFSNGQMDSEILAQVDGEKWTGKKPSKFYAFGETYNNTDDFLEQIRSKWTWKPVSADYDSLSVNPGYPDLSQGEIDQLLDSYRPLI